jgi:hypothetical protein
VPANHKYAPVAFVSGIIVDAIDQTSLTSPKVAADGLATGLNYSPKSESDPRRKICCNTAKRDQHRTTPFLENKRHTQRDRHTATD